MVPPRKAIDALSSQLPDYSGMIAGAFAESAEFRSICADFYVCSRALAYWRDTESVDASAHREEYRTLLQEIKQEALSWLDTSQGITKTNP
jgi:hypothetical protein